MNWLQNEQKREGNSRIKCAFLIVSCWFCSCFASCMFLTPHASFECCVWGVLLGIRLGQFFVHFGIRSNRIHISDVKEGNLQEQPSRFPKVCMYACCIHACMDGWIDRSIHPSIHPSIRQSVRPSIHRSIHPSIHLRIYVSMHLCTYVSMYLCIYVSM